MRVEVDEEFIREAYAAACLDWKNKLEAKFPQLFGGLGKIKRLPEYGPYGEYAKVEKRAPDRVVICLPNNNKGWTFAAWELTKAICKLYPSSFPRHEGNPQEIVIDDIDFERYGE